MARNIYSGKKVDSMSLWELIYGENAVFVKFLINARIILILLLI